MTREEIKLRLTSELPAEFDLADELTGGFLEARIDRLLDVAERVEVQALLPILAISSGWYLSRIAAALGTPRRTDELDSWLRQRVRLAVFSKHQGTALGIKTALAELLVNPPEIVEWVRDTTHLGTGRSFLGGPRNWLRDPATDEGGAFSFLVRLRATRSEVGAKALFLGSERFLGTGHHLFDAAQVTYSVPLWVVWWLVNRLRMAGTVFRLEIV